MRRRRSEHELAMGLRGSRRPTPARTLRSNRALARRHRSRGISRRLGLLLALVLGFAAGLGVSRLDALRIPAPGLQAVAASVTGHHWLAPAEVARLSGIGAGTPLARVEPGQVAERIASHPWVAAARVAVMAPGRLLLSVEERVPRARVRIHEVVYWVDGGGVAFAPAGAPLEGAALALIEGVDAEVGVPNPDLAAAIVLLERFARRPIGHLRALRVGDAPADQLPILEVQGPGGPLRVLLGADPPAALARLERVLAAGVPAVATAGEIDVRFDDQAILRPAPALAPRQREREPALGRGPLGSPIEEADEGRDENPNLDATARGDAAAHSQDARG